MIVAADAGRLPLADGSVDCALTSPPYWGGLRVYDGEQARDWPAGSYSPMPGLPPIEIPASTVPLGHEADPFAFVWHLLLVFREVRRVLKPGGCLAVNLGDCYSTSPHQNNGNGPSSMGAVRTAGGGGADGRNVSRSSCGPPSKNLVLMPHRFALAMQADGWVLRSRMPGGVEVFPEDDVGIEPDIVWRKKACMPESVRDRPTVDFEDVLIFSQAPRYFWDQEAGREASGPDVGRSYSSGRGDQVSSRAFNGHPQRNHSGGFPSEAAGRNMRSVWTINPEPTSEPHFAAWPTKLAARLIRVMTSERGVCPTCGAPWVRQVERTPDSRPRGQSWGVGQKAMAAGRNEGKVQRIIDPATGSALPVMKATTTGWAPSCDCGEGLAEALAAPFPFAVPATVLDPFAGLGRTWEAATLTGRKFIGADLGLGYCRLARSRNDVEAAERRKLAERAKTITGPLFAGEVGPWLKSWNGRGDIPALIDPCSTKPSLGVEMPTHFLTPTPEERRLQGGKAGSGNSSPGERS
jgi:hypothetical protein